MFAELVKTIGPIIPVILTIITGLWKFRKDILTSIERNKKKIDVLSAGVLAQYKSNPGLDVERFQEALEENGCEPEDFIKD